MLVWVSRWDRGGPAVAACKKTRAPALQSRAGRRCLGGACPDPDMAPRRGCGPYSALANGPMVAPPASPPASTPTVIASPVLLSTLDDLRIGIAPSIHGHIAAALRNSVPATARCLVQRVGTSTSRSPNRRGAQDAWHVSMPHKAGR